MKVLITGVDGFTGRYLAALLVEAGHDVMGLVHHPLQEPIPGVLLFVCDLADASAVREAVEKLSPDWVAHLAAISFVAHGDIEAIYRTNVVGTRNLLEALAGLDVRPASVLLASSANVYGNATEGVIDENSPLAPANDYAVSKLAMEYVARLYQSRLPITIVRPFNYTGVGQSESFLLPKIVNHVRRKAPVIELGNLDVARDFSDVRMVVAYYKRLMEGRWNSGDVFNVCSGQAYTLREVLEMVRKLSLHSFEVRVNPAFVRASEVKKLVGSSLRLVDAVGAVPVIPLRETLRWMLES